MSSTAKVHLEVAGEDSGVHRSPRGVPAFSWPDLVVVVRNQVRSLVGPTRDLEDLTQATLEQIVRAIDGFEGRCDLRTFTYRIASRVVMNHWRSLKRYFRRFVAAVEDAPDPATEEHDPAGLLERQRAKRLHHHLERLSAEQRLVVVLADLEEMPASAIAEIVECPEATVRSRLKRGRADLARRLMRDPLFSDAGGGVS
jgi:RNA polymerase sigma-70 factor (ECF subfamily)